MVLFFSIIQCSIEFSISIAQGYVQMYDGVLQTGNQATISHHHLSLPYISCSSYKAQHSRKIHIYLTLQYKIYTKQIMPFLNHFSKYYTAVALQTKYFLGKNELIPHSPIIS